MSDLYYLFKVELKQICLLGSPHFGGITVHFDDLKQVLWKWGHTVKSLTDYYREFKLHQMIQNLSMDKSFE